LGDETAGCAERSQVIDYTVYLGPFLECEYVIEEVTCYFVACPREACLRYRIGTIAMFCHICGTPTERFPETKYRPNVKPFELVDEIDEALFPVPLEYIELDESVHIWTPNVARDDPREFSINPLTDYQVTLIVDGQKDIEEDWFTSAFSEEIELLERHYEECNVLWGILVYAR